MLVVGGGPAGMKAAVIAATRGHHVELHERSAQLGGQVNLAAALPGRAEFGGVSSNLQHELKQAGVRLHLQSSIDESGLREFDPAHVVIATGAVTRLPRADVDDVDLVDAWSVIRGQASVGTSVVVADWSCDWNGLGVAEMLAREGHHVRLLSGGSVAGESIQAIVRDHWIGVLHGLGVEMTPYARFYGAAEGSAYFQHMTSGEAIVCDDVDTIVSCFAPRTNRDCAWMETLDGIAVTRVGDALAPRSVEEAVLEAVRAAVAI